MDLGQGVEIEVIKYPRGIGVLSIGNELDRQLHYEPIPSARKPKFVIILHGQNERINKEEKLKEYLKKLRAKGFRVRTRRKGRTQ